MRLIRLIVVVVVVVVACPLPLVAQGGDLDEILDRVADYVELYERTFVGVVSEEAYRQQGRGGRTGTDLRGFPIEATSQRRDLRSDVLLVRAPAADRWIQFRDVFEVDGKPVRDRDDRLTKLFLQPSADARRQEEDIAAASARYNIGGVNRTVNLPILALTVLETKSRPRFTFHLGKRSRDAVAPEYKEETLVHTLVQTNDDRPLRGRGRLPTDPATGRVLNSTLATERATLRAQIDISYASEAAVGMLVPREMREKYTSKEGMITEGRARYANFRRYQVKVDEKIGTVKK